MTDKKNDKEGDETKNLMLYTLRWDSFAKNGLQKNGLVKRRIHDKTESKWVAIVFNYLVFYHSKKGQPPDASTDDAWFEKYYNILKIENFGAISDDKVFGFEFDDPREKDPRGKRVRVLVDTWEEQEDWVKKINKHVRELQRAMHELNQIGGPEHILQEMMKELPKGYNPGHVAQPEDIAHFTTNMKNAFDRVRAAQTNAGLLRNFADYYNTNTKLYLDWVLHGIIDENASRHLQRIEKQNVDAWKSRITSDVKGIREMFETRFFREDLDTGSKTAAETIRWIDGFTHYASTVHDDWPANEFAGDRELLTLFSALVEKLPFSKDLTLASLGPGQGAVLQGAPKSAVYRGEKWVWAPVAGNQATVMRLHCTSHANVPAFACPNGFEFLSEGWGAVLWNRVSWCWFHPKVRFTIRYDWIATERKFRFHHHSDKKAGELALPDWRWSGQGVEPLFDNKPEKITFDPFHTQGQVPAPVVLLVAMLFHIQETVSLLLPNVARPVRIHADEQNAVFYRPHP